MNKVNKIEKYNSLINKYSYIPIIILYYRIALVHLFAVGFLSPVLLFQSVGMQ